MGMKFDLKGVDELIKRLKKTQLEVVEEVAPKALREAAKVVATEAKRRAELIDDPKSPENISKNITVQKSSKRNTPQDAVKYRVGVRGGGEPNDDKNPSGGDTWYWRLIEFGTVKMEAKPFMRPAMAAKQQEAAAVFISSFKEELDKVIK
ncbi:hypothetical protein GCM10007161_13450 [Ignatzschineria indica]|uniref:HK97 gp10 family phage protein n=2 Tax=Ignatzschineria indica TaxID=472583 RepID=A0A2U2AJX3_9GAMM|nr:HK97-gp10 family putative phage morphogenesis protein [Ignatzschineria indica]PWD83059.1 hypothetical protein DC082_06435 [Ignatzschineria indica]GGZ83274.1 hypothetical protein GCM10007161_13450 [Ignatzschineria indica]